jgi:hypothetical protein
MVKDMRHDDPDERKVLQVVSDDEEDGRSSDDNLETSKQILALAISSNQRERAEADANYIRTRNLFTITGTLFFAAQVALIGVLGKEVNGQPVVSSSEIGVLGTIAAVGAITLACAFGYLILRVERGKKYRRVDHKTLTDIMDHEGPEDEAVQMLAIAAVKELKGWRKSNKSRRTDYFRCSIICALAALSATTEMVMLMYFVVN